MKLYTKYAIFSFVILGGFGCTGVRAAAEAEPAGLEERLAVGSAAARQAGNLQHGIDREDEEDLRPYSKYKLLSLLPGTVYRHYVKKPVLAGAAGLKNVALRSGQALYRGGSGVLNVGKLFVTSVVPENNAVVPENDGIRVSPPPFEAFPIPEPVLEPVRAVRETVSRASDRLGQAVGDVSATIKHIRRSAEAVELQLAGQQVPAAAGFGAERPREASEEEGKDQGLEVDRAAASSQCQNGQERGGILSLLFGASASNELVRNLGQVLGNAAQVSEHAALATQRLPEALENVVGVTEHARQVSECAAQGAQRIEEVVGRAQEGASRALSALGLHSAATATLDQDGVLNYADSDSDDQEPGLQDMIQLGRNVIRQGGRFARDLNTAQPSPLGQERPEDPGFAQNLVDAAAFGADRVRLVAEQHRGMPGDGAMLVDACQAGMRGAAHVVQAVSGQDVSEANRGAAYEFGLNLATIGQAAAGGVERLAAAVAPAGDGQAAGPAVAVEGLAPALQGVLNSAQNVLDAVPAYVHNIGDDAEVRAQRVINNGVRTVLDRIDNRHGYIFPAIGLALTTISVLVGHRAWKELGGRKGILNSFKLFIRDIISDVTGRDHDANDKEANATKRSNLDSDDADAVDSTEKINNAQKTKDTARAVAGVMKSVVSHKKVKRIEKGLFARIASWFVSRDAVSQGSVSA